MVLYYLFIFTNLNLSMVNVYNKILRQMRNSSKIISACGTPYCTIGTGGKLHNYTMNGKIAVQWPLVRRVGGMK